MEAIDINQGTNVYNIEADNWIIVIELALKLFIFDLFATHLLCHSHIKVSISFDCAQFIGANFP